MTPEMIAALAQERASVTAFFEIDLPSGTRRLMLGSGEVAYGGNVFKGYDPTIGSIDSGETLREDVSGDAPNTSLTVKIAGTANKVDVAGAVVALAPVRISLAALTLDANKHLVAIPDPELLFSGVIDQATVNLDKNQDEVTYTVVSGFDYFFEDNEGQRLNNPFHQSIWPGETGLANVTGVTRKIYWGAYGPNSTGGTTSTGSYGGGGGYTGGGISGGILVNQV